MTTSDLLTDADQRFQKALTSLKGDLAGLQTGRASPALVEGLMVDSYGQMMPLKHLANISVPEARSLAIQPFDRGQMQSIEKAIRDSSLGLNPNSDGIRIILNIPPLTEERRRDLTKVASRMGEEARIAVRNIRQDNLNTARRLKTEGEVTEDAVSVFEKKLQEKVDSINTAIEEAVSAKEADIMKV